MAKRSMFVGMDVHKDSIDISLAEEGRAGEVRHDGRIARDLEALAKVVKALRAPAPVSDTCRAWQVETESGDRHRARIERVRGQRDTRRAHEER